MLYSVAPVLAVGDVEKTISWYQKVFGFDADPYPAEPPFCFAILYKHNIEIMLRQVEGFAPRTSQPHAWDYYVRLRGGRIQELYAHVKNQTSILRPLEKAFYNEMEFEVTDCNGYVLCFSEPCAAVAGEDSR
ncbi:MAG: hypothetical protein K1Y36_28705 [Blastocatellia bacterium]|nr:hypothetical protein [Blastocatellia bacterium]